MGGVTSAFTIVLFKELFNSSLALLLLTLLATLKYTSLSHLLNHLPKLNVLVIDDFFAEKDYQF